MDLEPLEKRQAVTAWRDTLVLALRNMFNEAGIDARADLERHKMGAGIAGAIWNPDAFSFPRVDAVMLPAVTTSVPALLSVAAAELTDIDPRYGPLGVALAESAAQLVFPVCNSADDESELTSLRGAMPNPAASRDMHSASAGFEGNGFLASAREAGSRALAMLGEASDAASEKLQSGTGLHDRLRTSALSRLTMGWAGESGDPLPVLGQLLAVVGEVTSEARSMAL